jgi:hypothetical protein
LRAHPEVGHDVQSPPLLTEIGECFLATGQQIELAGALAPHYLGFKRLCVSLAAGDLGALTAQLVAPANTPDGAALPFDSLNAHATRS